MLIVFFRTIIVSMIVLLALRMMGKSELSEMSTFQMVILFMIAELAAIPIDSPDASLLHGATAIFTLLFLQVLLSLLSMKSETCKNLINGRPSILIDNGRINVREMRRLRITIHDLFEQLRIKDCPDLHEIAFAVLESSGDLSVIKRQKVESMPVILVSDGTVYHENLKKAHMTEPQLLRMLESKGITGPKEVFVAFCDAQHRFHLYPKPASRDAFSEEVV